MLLKTCFIASAGFGTRMGALGKIIPKPLWPFFNMRMLDLQVEYVRKLGCENIFINSHHCHEEMQVWLEKKNDPTITLIHEPQILGSGGCIHNLKNYIHDEIILIINSDQFYFFDFATISTSIQEMIQRKAVAHLFAIEVDANASYNETVVKDGTLVDIAPHEGQLNYLTYSGVGIIDLSRVKYVEGESSFFKTVCDYKNHKVLMKLPVNPTFLDLGTLDKYIDVISNLDLLPQVIKDFLLNVDGLKVDEFKKSSHFSWDGIGFNLDQRVIEYRGKTYSF